MTKQKKILLISIGAIAVLGLGTVIIYPAVKRNGMRKRLDAAYNAPFGVESVGGLDKLQVMEVFDTRRWDRPDSKRTISRMEARERAKQIWENYSVYYLYDDEAAIIGAFNGLRHVDDVSLIAHEFYMSYQNELLSVLEDGLDEKNKAQYQSLMGKLMTLPRD